MVAGVLLGARYGTYGVAIGFTIAMSLLAIPSIWYALRGSPVRVADLTLIALGLSLVIFTAGYGVAWLVLPGGIRAASELLTAVRETRARTRR